MLREVFSNRLFIGALAFFILCVVGGTLYIAYIERQGIEDVAPETEEPDAPLAEKPKPPPPGESAESGHWHGDEWHSEPHETEPAVPAVVNTAPAVPRGEPFANFTPDLNDDPVTTAYKRLEYIKNNPHEWGNFSPQTLELVDDLTPVPNIRAGDVIPGEGEGIIEQLEELSDLRDPRSAELLLAWQMDSGLMGRPIDEALVAMGPAAVPALVARLDDFSGETYLMVPMELLDLIIAENRSELGSIVEHIIIPKLEAIAASNSPYSNVARHRVAELQQ